MVTHSGNYVNIKAFLFVITKNVFIIFDIQRAMLRNINYEQFPRICIHRFLTGFTSANSLVFTHESIIA